MKIDLETIASTLLLIGTLILMFTTPMFMVYTLYLWGSVGLALGVSLWTSLVLCSKVVLGSVGAILLGAWINRDSLV